MYQVVQNKQRIATPEASAHLGLAQACFLAFIEAGTLDLSLDQLAARVRSSKRMLVHYFGGREALEERAMTLLEERLRTQFAPETLPGGASLPEALDALWERTTDPRSKGVLLLVMELTRRAWRGSGPAIAFCGEQQRLWVELLLRYLPERKLVEDILQSFQGAVLAYLITGNPEPGRRMLKRLCKSAGLRADEGKKAKKRRKKRHPGDE